MQCCYNVLNFHTNIHKRHLIALGWLLWIQHLIDILPQFITMNEHDCISKHQPHDCLLNRLFMRRSKKTSKLSATGLCAGNSPLTGEFPAHKASNTENVSIWWRHHVLQLFMQNFTILDLITMALQCSYLPWAHLPTWINFNPSMEFKSLKQLQNVMCQLKCH